MMFYETVSEINQRTNLFGGKIEIVIVMILSMDGSVENFLSDIVSKEISFAKENLIDYRTENGYCFGFYEGSVECLYRIIERFLSINSTSCVTTVTRRQKVASAIYKNQDTRKILTFLLVTTCQNAHERRLQ